MAEQFTPPVKPALRPKDAVQLKENSHTPLGKDPAILHMGDTNLLIIPSKRAQLVLANAQQRGAESNRDVDTVQTGGNTIVIGRDAKSPVASMLRSSPTVSREQVILRYDSGASTYVIDQQKTVNPTWVSHPAEFTRDITGGKVESNTWRFARVSDISAVELQLGSEKPAAHVNAYVGMNKRGVPTLYYFDRDGKFASRPLQNGDDILLGRDPLGTGGGDNVIQIQSNILVSRTHARVVYGDGMVAVTDAGSANGTQGKMISQRELGELVQKELGEFAEVTPTERKIVAALLSMHQHKGSLQEVGQLLSQPEDMVTVSDNQIREVQALIRTGVIGTEQFNRLLESPYLIQLTREELQDPTNRGANAFLESVLSGIDTFAAYDHTGDQERSILAKLGGLDSIRNGAFVNRNVLANVMIDALNPFAFDQLLGQSALLEAIGARSGATKQLEYKAAVADLKKRIYSGTQTRFAEALGQLYKTLTGQESIPLPAQAKAYTKRPYDAGLGANESRQAEQPPQPPVVVTSQEARDVTKDPQAPAELKALGMMYQYFSQYGAVVETIHAVGQMGVHFEWAQQRANDTIEAIMALSRQQLSQDYRDKAAKFARFYIQTFNRQAKKDERLRFTNFVNGRQDKQDIIDAFGRLGIPL